VALLAFYGVPLGVFVVDRGPDRACERHDGQRRHNGQRHDSDLDTVARAHERISPAELRQAPAPPGHCEPLHDTLLGHSRTEVWIDHTGKIKPDLQLDA